LRGALECVEPSAVRCRHSPIFQSLGRRQAHGVKTLRRFGSRAAWALMIKLTVCLARLPSSLLSSPGSFCRSAAIDQSPGADDGGKETAIIVPCLWQHGCRRDSGSTETPFPKLLLGAMQCPDRKSFARVSLVSFRHSRAILHLRPRRCDSELCRVPPSHLRWQIGAFTPLAINSDTQT